MIKKFDQFINESDEFNPINVDMVTEAEPSNSKGISWLPIGKEYLFHNEDKIKSIIDKMEWLPFDGKEEGLTQGEAIKSIIDNFEMRGEMYSISTDTFATSADPEAAYYIIGVQDANTRLYVVDAGDDLIPIGFVRLNSVVHTND